MEKVSALFLNQFHIAIIPPCKKEKDHALRHYLQYEKNEPTKKHNIVIWIIALITNKSDTPTRKIKQDWCHYCQIH